MLQLYINLPFFTVSASPPSGVGIRRLTSTQLDSCLDSKSKIVVDSISAGGGY